MKKGSLIAVLVTLVVLVSGLAFAYNFPINDLGTSAQSLMLLIQDVFGPIFSFLLGVDQFGQYFFARVLLLILLYIIILTVMKRIEIFNKSNAVCILISAIVSIFAARFMSELDIVNFILLPYGVMGIAIAVFLPFLIYFFFVHYSISSGIGRMAAWALFAIVFFGMWISRRVEVGDYGWMYAAGIGAVIVIGFIFDGKIHEYFGIAESNKLKREQIKLQIADLEAKLAQLRAVPTPSKIMLESIDNLERRLKGLYKQM